MILIFMKGAHDVDNHLIRSVIRLIHPTVIRNVFSMTMDEMNTVYDLDFKVGFTFNLLKQ